MRPLSIPNTVKRPTSPHKATKESVLYIFRPETQYTCEKCVFKANDEVTKCALLSPSELIKPHGTCGFWIHFNPDKAGMSMMPFGGVSKQEAGYAENKQGFSCKRCRFFDPTALKCAKVDENSIGDTPGVIHPNACCNAWEKDPTRGDMTIEQLSKK